jgi:hypothetical protein
MAPRLPEESMLPSAVALELTGSGDALASTQHPAYIMVELSGRGITSVSQLAGSVLADGRRRILVYESLDPDPGDSLWPGEWTNGVHDLVETWDFTADYLWDGQQGDFAVLRMTRPETDTRTVHGRYRAAGSDDFVDAALVVNIAEGKGGEVIIQANGETEHFVAGDEFQLIDLFLDDDGVIESKPGATLSFTEGGHIAYTRTPVINGAYFLGVGAETNDGQVDSVYASYEVDNERLTAGYTAYLDAGRGYQLLYPETWPAPVEQDGQLLFSDPQGDTVMTVSWHPEMSGRPIADLKQRVLDAYGDVTVLYEDQVVMGASAGKRTVYGYSALEGPRTGILLTFALDEQVYAVDIDGPARQEDSLQTLAGIVAASWTGRDLIAASSGRWVESPVDGLLVQTPAGYLSQQLSNGWQRFAADDDLTFLAMRGEPAAGRPLAESLAHWLEVAGGGVTDLAASEVYLHERDGRGWARVDFEYKVTPGQQIGGVLMATELENRFLILWAEAPLNAFDDFESRVLLTVVDDLSRYDRAGSEGS